MLHYYILFQNHTDSQAMYQALKKQGFNVKISPTPRELSVCCGVSLLIEEKDVSDIIRFAGEKKLSYISVEGLNNSFDNTRHKYG